MPTPNTSSLNADSQYSFRNRSTSSESAQVYGTMNSSNSDGLSNSDSDIDYVPRRRLFSSSTSSSSLVSSATNKRRRRYIHKTRTVRPKNESKRRLQWMSMLSLSDSEIRSKKCCTFGKCFVNVDISRLRQSMTSVFSSSRNARRSILSQMYTSSGSFFFDGRRVCSIFLVEAFRFSTELQSSVRFSCGSTVADTDSNQLISNDSLLSNPNTIAPSLPTTFQDLHDDNNHGETDRSVKRDAIITFLNRTANSMANFMPDNNQRHLPFVNKISVFNRFKYEFGILYPSLTSPSENYFYATWKMYCSDIKVRRAIRFTKCATCERIRTALLDATSRNLSTDDLLLEQSKHLEFIYNERLEYKSKVELAKLKPLEYLSIVVDGADQSAYSLPHFIFDVKDQRGLGIKVHLIGLLHHAQQSILQLYTMTDEHKKGSNHIIEVIHRFVNEKAKAGPLPKKLFIQLDNCSRENKNKFVMSYFDALIRWGVFDEIQAAFLPVGHTHCDIDQAFSSTSNRLKTHDAITLQDLQIQLRSCYNENTVVMDLKQVANWSGLCDQTNCCHEIDHITKYRFFRFSVSQTNSDDIAHNAGHEEKEGGQATSDSTDNAPSTILRTTNVKVRYTSKDNWISLESVNGGTNSFLRHLPDLSITPPEELQSPEDVDKITARIESETHRIDSEEKLASLFSLRDEIFRTRSVKFHWNLAEIVEMKALNLRREPNQEEIEVAALESNGLSSLSSRLRYDMDSFVAVRGTIGSTDIEIWVGRIVDRIRNKNGSINQLKVHWYERHGDGDMFTCKYRPWYVLNKSTKRKNIPWLSKISCDSVLNCFPTLTSQRRLPIVVANDLRERTPSTS